MHPFVRFNQSNEPQQSQSLPQLPPALLQHNDCMHPQELTEQVVTPRPVSGHWLAVAQGSSKPYLGIGPGHLGPSKQPLAPWPRLQHMSPAIQIWSPHLTPLAKAVPIPARPRMLPMVAAAIVLRAPRRECEDARALVKSSKRSGFISLSSFLMA